MAIPDVGPGMIPVVVFWTEYTATLNGRVLKLVPCENCSTEYVYVLEREGTGVGTSVYALNDEGARDNAASSAGESLREYLANDFDPVPCPTCGHYQRYMFPKLYETKSLWGAAAKLVLLALGCLDTACALSWSVAYLQQPNDHGFWRVVLAWSLLAVLVLIGIGLTAIECSKAGRFDPNVEDQQARINKGRVRAVTRSEFDAGQQRERSAEDGVG